VQVTSGEDRACEELQREGVVPHALLISRGRVPRTHRETACSTPLSSGAPLLVPRLSRTPEVQMPRGTRAPFHVLGCCVVIHGSFFFPNLHVCILLKSCFRRVTLCACSSALFSAVTPRDAPLCRRICSSWHQDPEGSCSAARTLATGSTTRHWSLTRPPTAAGPGTR